MWECRTTVEGADVLLRFSELDDTPTGRAYYEDQYAAGERTTISDAAGRAERFVWRLPEPNGDGVYKLSSMYVEHPYSISVESSDRAARDTALDTLVTFARPDEVLGAG